MGASPSVLSNRAHSSSSDANAPSSPSREHSILAPVLTSYLAVSPISSHLAPAVSSDQCRLLLQFREPGENASGDEFYVDKTLVGVCDLSWKMIASSNNPVSPTRNVGLFAFCERFFFHMSDLDVDNSVEPKFHPRSQSRCPSRGALLMTIVKYMLAIPHDKFSSKAKIRKLGRAHASRGIRAPHFQIFAKAFMSSLCDVLGSQFRGDVCQSWSMLLNFFVYELCYENVTFVPHHTTEDEYALQQLKETFERMDTNDSTESNFTRVMSDASTFARGASEASNTDSSGAVYLHGDSLKQDERSTKLISVPGTNLPVKRLPSVLEAAGNQSLPPSARDNY